MAPIFKGNQKSTNLIRLRHHWNGLIDMIDLICSKFNTNSPSPSQLIGPPHYYYCYCMHLQIDLSVLRANFLGLTQHIISYRISLQIPTSDLMIYCGSWIVIKATNIHWWKLNSIASLVLLLLSLVYDYLIFLRPWNSISTIHPRWGLTHMGLVSFSH